MRLQGQKVITDEKTMSFFFLFFGLASAIAMAIVIYNGIGSDDFFYVNETVNGVTSREYRPATVIFLLIFWGLATAAFFFAGYKLMPRRRKSATHSYSLNSTLFDNENDSAQSSSKKGGIGTGVIFLIIGLVSAAIPVVLSLDTEDLTQSDTLFLYGASALFAIPFIIGGIIMIRKRYQGGTIMIGGIAESGEKGFSGTFRSKETVVAGKHTKRLYVGDTAKSFLKIFGILGALLIAIGGGLLVWDRTSLQSLSRVEATVLRTYSESHSYSNSVKSYTVYFADVSYMLDGQEYKSRLTVSMFFNKSTVSIYCDPENPLDCRMNNEFIMWYIVLFSVGVSFIVVGFIIVRVDKKERKKNTFYHN